MERNIPLCASNIVNYVIYDSGGNFIQNANLSTTSGVNLNSVTFNPGSSSVDVDVNAITDYRGFGEIVLEVMDQLGNICFLTVTVVECCDNTNPHDFLFVNEYLPPTNFNNAKVIYYGDVTVENSEFDNCEVLGGVDAQLIIVDRILGSSSTFSNLCSYRWDRIHLPNSSASLNLDNCTLEYSLRGAFTEDDGEVDAQSTIFNNNMISLFVENHTATGPFNGSYINLSDNTFTDLQSFSVLGQHPSSSISLSSHRGYVCANASSTLSIGIKGSSGVRIGESINSINTFANPSNNGGDKAYIEVGTSHSIIENNTFSGCCVAICSYNNSRVHIGGQAANQKNAFNEISVQAQNSAIIAEKNDFYGNCGIGLINPSYLNVTSSYLDGDHLTDNIFWGSDGGSIAYNSPGSNTTYSRIYNNTFFGGGVIEVNDFYATGTKKLIIHSNTLSNTGSIRLYNVDNAVVANNSLNMSALHTPSSAASPVAYGIDLFNAQNSTIKSNSLNRYNRGVQIAGNCAGTQFTCNTLVNNFYGFYLDVCYIDHQGSVGNTTGNEWISVWSGGRQLQGTATQLFSPRKAWFYSTSIPNQVLNILPSPIDNFIRRRPEVNINPCTAVPSFKTTNPNVDASQAGSEEIPHEELVSNFSGDILLFPNPVTDYLTLEVPDYLLGTKLLLSNSQGQVILAEQLVQNKQQIDFSYLSAGTYILRMGENHNRIVKW